MLKLSISLKFIRALVEVSGLPDLEADDNGLKSSEALSEGFEMCTVSPKR